MGRGHRAAGRPASRWPNPVAVALASLATAGLVMLLMHPARQNTSRLRAGLSAAVRSLAQDAELSPGPTAQASVSAGSPAIGALFVGAGGRLGSHFCTASVVNSPHGNLVLTAAHCISGIPSSQVVFVPDYHDGRAPYGVWRVARVIVDHAWAVSADPDDDVAFLVVAGQRDSGQRDGDVARRTGSERLSFAEPYGQTVQVTGYPSTSDVPIRCVNQVRWHSPDQLQFDCSGYSAGTSGSPLLSGASPATGLGTVIGVIGGYQKGGDTSGVSYAARFGSGVAALYRTALARS
jgi:V8-like Glu-specific endopeptidase